MSDCNNKASESKQIRIKDAHYGVIVDGDIKHIASASDPRPINVEAVFRSAREIETDSQGS